jgi:hypothetical protein
VEKPFSEILPKSHHNNKKIISNISKIPVHLKVCQSRAVTYSLSILLQYIQFGSSYMVAKPWYDDKIINLKNSMQSKNESLNRQKTKNRKYFAFLQ